MDVNRDLTGAEANRALPKGLPIYSLDGKMVGKTNGQPALGDGVALHRGFIVQHDAVIPLHMVQRIEQDGVYLNRNHEEVEDLARGGWSNLGERDLTTGAAAGQDVGTVPTFPDGNNSAGNSTSTGLTTGLPRDNAEARREEQLATPPTTETPLARRTDQMLPPKEQRTVREVVIDPDVDEPRR